MDITISNNVISNYAANARKTHTNTHVVQGAKKEANNSPTDIVEISEEAKTASANNVKSNAGTDSDATLRQYMNAVLDSMATTHEDVRAWLEHHNYKQGQVIGLDIVDDGTFIMRNSSASTLFESNKDNPYLQELTQKLGLTEEQSREMSDLIYNQFNSLSAGLFEVDNSTYLDFSEKILASMKDLIAKFNGTSET